MVANMVAIRGVSYLYSMENTLFNADKEQPVKRGRPKYSVLEPKGMLLRFVKRNISPNKLQDLYSRLTPWQKADFLKEVLPYILSKKQPDSISADEIDLLYSRLEQAVNDAKQTG